MKADAEEHGFLVHQGRTERNLRSNFISTNLFIAGKRGAPVVAQDISERRLWNCSCASPKMEGRRRLTGRVSRTTFTILLMVIKRATRSCCWELGLPGLHARKIEQIDRSPTALRQLTRRELLAFSRLAGPCQPQIISLNSVVEEDGQKLWPRLIGVNNRIGPSPGQKLGTIRADAKAQMNRSYMNSGRHSQRCPCHRRQTLDWHAQL